MEVSKLMEDMDEGRCKCFNCIYWCEDTKPYDPNDIDGVCRRHAPTSQDQSIRNSFPRTSADCWCGEFELAP